MKALAYVDPNYYDKITDLVYNIGRFNLKLVVLLNTVSNKGKEYNHYSEVLYENERKGHSIVKINRMIDSYLIIDDWYNKNVYVIIRPNNVVYLHGLFRVAFGWMNDEEVFHPDLRSGNPMIVEYRQVKREFDKGYIEMIPYYEDQKGVKIFMDPLDKEGTFIPEEYVQGLWYMLNSFNIYHAASTLMAWYGRPENGTNRYTMH